ncbi:MAG: anti-sigma factor antagonist [Coriobacteriia bacterium]|nr:anti-sigma factor antagonist [Coriobacteriia bacterium]
MKIVTEHDGDGLACVVQLEGEIDIVSVPEVRDALESAMNRGCSNLVLNLARVTYLDSSALGLLVWADRQLSPRDGHLVLAGADRNVSRILKISGLVAAAPGISAADDPSTALAELELNAEPESPIWVREVEFPAVPASLARARAEVCDMLESLAIPEPEFFDIRVAVGEALANAIRHGSPRGDADPVSVSVEAYDDRVVLVVTDHGAGFDGETSPDGDPYAASGRGVMFMRALMDRVEFVRQPGGGTAVTLVHHIAPAAQ